MLRSNKLYLRVLDISADYLGPASERFVARQIENHLNKQPDDLTARDLGKLIEWVSLAMSTLTDDKALKTEYINRLEDLTKDRASRQQNNINEA